MWEEVILGQGNGCNYRNTRTHRGRSINSGVRKVPSQRKCHLSRVSENAQEFAEWPE
jgi:hypothetical protein